MLQDSPTKLQCYITEFVICSWKEDAISHCLCFPTDLANQAQSVCVGNVAINQIVANGHAQHHHFGKFIFILGTSAVIKSS